MISVNNYTITEAEFDFAVSDYKNRTGLQELNKEQLMNVAEQLIDHKILLDRAVSTDTEVPDEQLEAAMNDIKSRYQSPEEFEQALKQSLLTYESLEENIKKNLALQNFIKNEFIDKTVISDEDAEKYYDSYKDKFTADEQVRASHILVDDKEKAEKIKSDIDNGANFAEVAKAESSCPSKEAGGDLGYFGKGMMVKEFEDACFNTESGTITDPIKTQFGYHIINVTEKKEAGVMDFTEVKDQLKSEIQRTVVNEKITKQVNELKKDYDINIDMEVLDSKK